MKKISLLFILFSFLSIGSAQSQELFTEADSLPLDMDILIRKIVLKKNEADSVSTSFETAFTAWDVTTQESVFNTTALFWYTKRYRSASFFKVYLRTLLIANNSELLSSADFQSYLEVLDSTAVYYPQKELLNFLKTGRTFFENKNLSKGYLSTVQLEEGTFEFKFKKPLIAIKEVEPEVSTEEVVEDLQLLDSTPEDELLDANDGFLEDTSMEETDTDDSWGSDDGGWGDDTTTDDDGWGSTDDAWGDDTTTDDQSIDLDGWGTATNDWEERPVDDSWEGSGTVGLLENDVNPTVQFSSAFMPTKINMPQVEGPFIEFEDAVIAIYSPYDTFKIKKVTGSFLMKNNDFVGSSGQADWTSVGLEENDVYCVFTEFHFNTTYPELEADFAMFHYDSKFDEGTEGYFHHKGVRNNGTDKANFPFFKSYNGGISFKDIVENVDYVGGITMRGKKVYGESFAKSLSTMTIYHDNNVKVKSYSFGHTQFGDSVLTSALSKVTLYKNLYDTIHNKGMNIRYDHVHKNLQLKEDKGVFKNLSFYDPYFNLNLYTDYLDWNIASDTINFSTATARRKVPFVVESPDFYDQNYFILLQGIYRFHPLLLVTGFANEFKTTSFTSNILSRRRNLNADVVRGAMIMLDAHDFIVYDQMSDMVTVSRKAFFYAAAKRKTRNLDFDNLKIFSRIDSLPNASLNFKNGEMTVRGISSFVVSDSLNVIISPDSGEVVFQKGRSFKFNGKILAGKFLINGQDFVFDYDSFKVTLNQVDSMAFIVQKDSAALEEGDEPMAGALTSSITETGGTLYITEPRNKSGYKNIPEYPKMNADKGGKIKFDREDIMGGIYKDVIYFDVPPFVIDSAGSGSTKEIKLNGFFKSSGIFPDFEETIYVKSGDKAFSFTRETPPEGYPIYNGKGHFYDTLSMGQNGLRGNGRIEYLSGTFFSQDFLFLPDTVSGIGHSGTIKKGPYGEEGTVFPEVNLTNYKMLWQVSDDTMQIISLREPLSIFENQYAMKGKLLFTPEGLYGAGKIEAGDYLVQSRFMSFEGDAYRGRFSDFKTSSNRPYKSSIYIRGANFHHDLEKEFVTISSENTKEQGFSFPHSEFVTDLDYGEWHLTDKIAHFSVESGKSANFIATRPFMDSLQFEGKTAYYDFEDYSLHVEGVEGINVGNVKILPKGQEIIMREKGKIDQLFDADIWVNAFTKYHLLTHANIHIVSRAHFEGEGIYSYINDVQDTFLIKFDKFQMREEKVKVGREIQSKFITTAQGTVDGASEFIEIYEGIYFKGGVHMVDSKEFLAFNGGLSLALDRPYNQWFEFKASEDEFGIVPIDDDTRTINTNEKLKTGLYINQTDKEFFCAFIENRAEWKGVDNIFQASGNLRYDNRRKGYQIAPLAVEEGTSLRGNSIFYDYNNQYIEFNGRVSYINPNNILGLQSAVAGKAWLKQDEYKLKSFFIINPPLSNKSIYEIGRLLGKNKNDKRELDLDQDSLELNMAQFISEGDMQQYREYSLGEYYTYLNFFKDYITLPNINLKWSDEHNAFYNTGRLYLYNVKDKEINLEVTGYMEIPKSVSNNSINIFLTSEEGEWFYISQIGKKLTFASSSAEFMLNLRPTEVAEIEVVTGYVNRFRRDYRAIDDPMVLKAANMESLGKGGRRKNVDESTGEEDYIDNQDDFNADEEAFGEEEGFESREEEEDDNTEDDSETETNDDSNTTNDDDGF